MSQQDDFKVFIGNHISVDGKPIVIVAGSSLAGELVFKYYIFMRNRENEFYERQLSATEKKYSEELDINFNFMMDMTRDQAIEDLNKHLSDKCLDKKDLRYLNQTYDLVEVDKAIILRLEKSNRHRAQLDSVHKDTRSKQLKEFLEMVASILITIDEHPK